MKSLIKLNIQSLINRYNIKLIIIVILLIIILSIAFGYNSYPNTLSDLEKNLIYLQNSYLFHKPILLFYSCNLFGYGFNLNNDSIRSLLIRDSKSRLRYLTSRIISLIIQLVIIWSITMLAFILIGLGCFNSFTIDQDLIKYLFGLLIYLINFGIISSIIMVIIPSDYSTMLVISFAIGSEMLTLTNYQELLDKVSFFISLMVEKDQQLIILNGIGYNLVLMGGYLGILFLAYGRKELF